MNPKIIDADRYKKTTTKKVKNKKRQKIAQAKYNKDIVKPEKTKKIRKKNVKNSKLFKIFACVTVIFLIGILSKKIVKLENIPIVKAFFNNDEKDFVKDYEFKIGLLNMDTTDVKTTKNMTLNEIINLSCLKLLEYDENYKINYSVLDNITTSDNRVFNLTLKKDYKINSDIVKTEIENIISLGENNIYFSKLKDVASINILDEDKLQITLNSSNPYFVYALDFPIYSTISDTKLSTDYVLAGSSQNIINFSKNNTKSTNRSINILNYDKSNIMVEEFKNQNLDMFVTSSDSVINLIGKYGYNIKKVRNGESIFILGNPQSKLYSRKEVRQAIAYSLNREELVKIASSSFTELIDLPYIYSDIRYKYDTYAATNNLISNGWKLVGGTYSNTLNGEKLDLNLSLLVNKDDIMKQKLAEKIKEMLEKISVHVNIELLSTEEIDSRIQEKNYDLVLASVNINSNPDIRYLESYININDVVNQAIENVNSSSINNLDVNIQNLQTVLSDQIACIGVVAYDTNVIYQKYIAGFDNLTYLNIFKKFNEIGRVQKID